jgi:MerR family transcriptional regulator/heat shock protein HspR
MEYSRQADILELFRSFIEQRMKEADVFIEEDDPVFPIEVVCKLTAIPYWTMRSILKEDIVQPAVVGKKKMLFSKVDVKKLECVHYLMEEKGVNIQGVKMFFEIAEGSDGK